MRIHFYKGTGLFGWLIQRFTWGDFAHVAIEVDGWIYEAKEGKGVIKRLVCDCDETACDCLEPSDLVLKAPKAIKGRAKRWLELQVGKKYDWWGCWGFVARKERQEQDKYFCSELLADCFDHCGLPLFQRHPAWKVSPSLASISPVLYSYKRDE